MSYKHVKWLILWIPTITIGLWEYVRHKALLPYISMELGNVLAPIIVLIVTVTLLRKLFARLENTQDALRREQILKAALEEREQLARELHDGISQSLFLLSVKLDRLDKAENEEAVRIQTGQIRETVRHVYADVRQSIAGLREAPVVTDKPWLQSIRSMIEDIRLSSGLQISLDWRLSDANLTAKQKVELFAIIREALLNVQKHAMATVAVVRCYALEEDGGGLTCSVIDNGVGIAARRLRAPGCYGLRMMESRAEAMGWEIHMGIPDVGAGTKVEIRSKGR